MPKNNYHYTQPLNCSGFLYLLTLLFIALKLTNVLDWTWWQVFAPLYVPFVFVLIASVLGYVLVGIYELISSAKKKLGKKS